MEDFLPPTSSRDILTILYRRRWSIAVILASTIVGALFWLFFIRADVYPVSARLLVKVGREQSPPATVLGSSPLVVGYRTNEVNSEIEILQSSQLLEQLIAELHLDEPSPADPVPEPLFQKVRYYVRKEINDLRELETELMIAAGFRERLTLHERVLDTLQKSLNVKAAKDSNVFVVVMGFPKRRGGKEILNRLLDDYLAFRQKIYSNSEYQFFDDAVDQSFKELESAEARAQEFDNRMEISNLTKQEESLLEQMSKLRAGVQDAALARNDAEFRVQRLEVELKKDEPNFGALGEFPRESSQYGIMTQLADLQRDREKLRLTELDTGDRIRNNRAQFDSLAAILAANLRSQFAQKQSDYAAQNGELNKLEEELRQKHGSFNDWIDQKRKVSDLETTYLTYRKKLSETKADDDMVKQKLGNVAIIERPIDPLQGVGMRKTTLLGICLLVGIFVALAWVAMAEYLDRQVYDAEQLGRELGAPVIAEFPRRSAA
jgi:uncharacterized protein involved in exopolysaccharide biosynthesis